MFVWHINILIVFWFYVHQNINHKLFIKIFRPNSCHYSLDIFRIQWTVWYVKVFSHRRVSRKLWAAPAIASVKRSSATYETSLPLSRRKISLYMEASPVLFSCFNEYSLHMLPSSFKIGVFLSAHSYFRFQLCPKGPCKHGESANVWLGSQREHVLRLFAQRRDPCTSQWPGCVHWDLERHIWVQPMHTYSQKGNSLTQNLI